MKEIYVFYLSWQENIRTTRLYAIHPNDACVQNEKRAPTRVSEVPLQGDGGGRCLFAQASEQSGACPQKFAGTATTAASRGRLSDDSASAFKRDSSSALKWQCYPQMSTFTCGRPDLCTTVKGHRLRS
jgi:hypothetical protein